MRTRRKISKEERLLLLREYLSSPITKSSFEKEKGLSKGAIYHWLRIFALEDKPNPIIMSEIEKTTDDELKKKIYALEQENKKLKTDLKYTTMARDAYNHMIDLAEETYNIKVRKNSDAR